MDKDVSETACKYGNMLAVISVAQLRDLVKRDCQWTHRATRMERERENNEVLKECDTERLGGSGQTALINSTCFYKRVWLCDLLQVPTQLHHFYSLQKSW